MVKYLLKYAHVKENIIIGFLVLDLHQGLSIFSLTQINKNRQCWTFDPFLYSLPPFNPFHCLILFHCLYYLFLLYTKHSGGKKLILQFDQNPLNRQPPRPKMGFRRRKSQRQDVYVHRWTPNVWTDFYEI